MRTIVEHSQGLVYSLLGLMPSVDQKASLTALLGLFLEAQGHPPAHSGNLSGLGRVANSLEFQSLARQRTSESLSSRV
jgi:hypothetical protein